MNSLAEPSGSPSRRCRSISRRCARKGWWPTGGKARRSGTASPMRAIEALLATLLRALLRPEKDDVEHGANHVTANNQSNRSAPPARPGSILVDIREADEHARETIAGARHLPLSRLDEAEPRAARRQAGHLSLPERRAHAGQRGPLAQKAGGCEAFVIEGGLDAWKKAGLPGRDRPPSADRAAASGADRRRQPGFLGTMLGLFVSPWFFAVPAVRRRWPDGCGRDRLLRHGQHPHARALESGDLRRSGQGRLRTSRAHLVQS